MSEQTVAPLRALHHGEERIEYRLRYTRRRSIGLYLFPDGRIELRAPQGCPPAEAEAFLHSKLEWLLHKRRQLRTRPVAEPPRFEEGGEHPYLGQRYPLRLRYGPAGGEQRGGAIVLRLRRPEDPAAVEQALLGWYRGQAHALFPQRLQACHRDMAHLGIPLPPLRIRRMRSRWGSCSSRGNVNLNLELIKHPLACIDYVICHELCHLLEFNHSPRFYALMDAVMPDWRERREGLRQGC